MTEAISNLGGIGMSIATIFLMLALLRLVLKVSFRVVRGLLFNSISGIVTLFILNFIGFNFPINPMNVIIVSFFGIPGLLGLRLF